MSAMGVKNYIFAITALSIFFGDSAGKILNIGLVKAAGLMILVGFTALYLIVKKMGITEHKEICEELKKTISLYKTDNLPQYSYKIIAILESKKQDEELYDDLRSQANIYQADGCFMVDIKIDRTVALALKSIDQKSKTIVNSVLDFSIKLMELFNKYPICKYGYTIKQDKILIRASGAVEDMVIAI